MVQNVLVKSSTALGALIKRRRAALGMRQEDLADAVGLGRSTIDALENGRSEKPEDIQLLKVFARVLKVSQIEILVAAELLDESEAQPFRPTAAVDQILQALDEVRGEVQVLRKEIHPDQGQ